MKTDPQIIHRFLSETRTCAMQMMENATYIKKELPSLTMPDALRAQITATCDGLIGTKFDLISATFDILELMDSSPDNASLGRRMESIRGMIDEEKMAFHACVLSATDAIKTGDADALVSLLLTESGLNILTSAPKFPEVEAFAEEATEEEPDAEPEPEIEEEDDNENDEENDGCYAFHTEDCYPVGILIEAVAGISDRQELTPETRDELRLFLFAMERLPLITPGVRMTLALRIDQGGESDWREIRIEDGEFSLGQGSWIDGDADTENVFEVSESYRDGDAFSATGFAESFTECAEDVCRDVVIQDYSDEPFTRWDLPLGKTLWGKLPCSFL